MVQQRRTKKEMIILITKFVEDFRKATLNKTVSVKEFSPGRWFKDHGVIDHALPARILEYLCNKVVERTGNRAGLTYKWVESVESGYKTTDFKVMAESAYESYRKWINTDVLPAPVYITPVLSVPIANEERFSICNEAYIIWDNRITKCHVVGLEKSKPYSEKSPIKIKLWLPNQKDPDFTLDLSSNEVFHNVAGLLKFLEMSVN